MSNFKVIFKTEPNNPSYIAQNELMNFIKEQFPHGTQGFYNYLHNRLSTSKIPYDNLNFKIIPPKAIVTLKRPNIQWSQEYPENSAPEVGAKTVINEWTVYNKKNDKSVSFASLAAIARAFNLSYSFLYNGIKKNNLFIIDNFIFYRNTILESIHYAEKIKELIKK